MSDTRLPLLDSCSQTVLSKFGGCCNTIMLTPAGTVNNHIWNWPRTARKIHAVAMHDAVSIWQDGHVIWHCRAFYCLRSRISTALLSFVRALHTDVKRQPAMIIYHLHHTLVQQAVPLILTLAALLHLLLQKLPAKLHIPFYCLHLALSCFWCTSRQDRYHACLEPMSSSALTFKDNLQAYSRALSQLPPGPVVAAAFSKMSAKLGGCLNSALVAMAFTVS